MGTELTQVSGQPKPAQDFINEMALIHKETRLALEDATAKMKKYYDRKR